MNSTASSAISLDLFAQIKEIENTIYLAENINYLIAEAEFLQKLISSINNSQYSEEEKADRIKALLEEALI